jgi:hypothetical protein
MGRIIPSFRIALAMEKTIGNHFAMPSTNQIERSLMKYGVSLGFAPQLALMLSSL